jgi:diguanylate cyclase (GGDEF)-like protein
LLQPADFELLLESGHSLPGFDRIPVSLLLLDIDELSVYNRAFGYEAGDQCIANTAEVVATIAESYHGIAAQCGSDEFVVVLPSSDVRQALIVAERIEEEVRGLMLRKLVAEGAGTTVSIGIASAGQSPVLLRELVREADRALYRVKQQRRIRRNTTS